MKKESSLRNNNDKNWTLSVSSSSFVVPSSNLMMMKAMSFIE
jgi:hypothetical protein